MADELPEEFAPTGPRLSKFPIRPAPPLRPHLFADEARFALRISILAGGTELVAWAWLSSLGRPRWLLLLAALRLAKPLWAWLGTRVARPAVAFALLFASLFGVSANLLTPLAGGDLSLLGVAAIGLPALGDLCASTIADSITVERRATAYAWLDMGQALGAVVGVSLGPVAAIASIPVLLGAGIWIPELRDRGTPRSTWPAAAYAGALRTPLAAQLTALAFACGILLRGARANGWAALLPLCGMAVASRLEARMPNAIWLPRVAVALAAAGLLWPPLRLFALGVMFAAIPAAVARGAGEMERPLVSSLAWSALFAGAALGAVL